MPKNTVETFNIQDLDPSGRVLNALSKRINFNIPVSFFAMKLGDIQELITIRDYQTFYRNTDMLPTSSLIILFGEL